MKNKLQNLPKDLLDLIYLASLGAKRKSVRVYLVGGFVRDITLGVNNFDLDIVVEGDGIEFAQELSYQLKAKVTIHRRFGTATILAGHHLALAKGCQIMASLPIKIDIASARKEIYFEPAALPIVEFGSLEDDLKRRDFTINAMAVDIAEENFGQVIDVFNGKNDLREGKIRILHDLSFIDDPTRILRAIRFEKRLGFKIERKTLDLLEKAVNSKMLEKVQAQRLRDELILILKEAQPVKYLKRIDELTGFRFLHPGLRISNNTLELLKSVEREINWFNAHHAQRRKIEAWLIYFMALLDSLKIKDIQEILENFVFRKGEEIRILSFKNIDKKFISALGRKKIKPSEIYNLLEPLSYETIILIKAKYKNPDIAKYIAEFLEVYNDVRILVSGHDLRRLGVSAGPFYQKIFKKVLNAKLNGQVKTYEEELNLIKGEITKCQDT